MRKLLLIPLLLLSTLSFASAPTRTYNYVSHAVIDPVQNNTNENNLYSYLQNGVDTFATGSITDISISATAAIAYSKLNLLNSIQGTDISTSAAIPYSKLNLTGTIVNADIASGAAIADSKLSTISTAGKVNVSSLTGVIATANLGSGTANSGTILYGDQTYKIAPASIGNCIFSFSSSVDSVGFVTATTFTGTISASYNYWGVTNDNSSYKTIIATKWVKISGVNTVTIWARIWQGGIRACQCKVSIGTANGNVTGTGSQVTPEWKSFTIDVSGLSNGTSYDVTIALQNGQDNATEKFYLGSIIAFGS